MLRALGQASCDRFVTLARPSRGLAEKLARQPREG